MEAVLTCAGIAVAAFAGYTQAKKKWQEVTLVIVAVIAILGAIAPFLLPADVAVMGKVTVPASAPDAPPPPRQPAPEIQNASGNTGIVTQGQTGGTNTIQQAPKK
jgi:hypothetical protein